jgi:ABC-2 type transport system ATP-binding protein
MPDPAIDVRALRKRYGDVEAVAGMDLRVERGEVFALLGPNGAGKTTAVEIMEGHRRRDDGNVSVLGYDPENGGLEFRRHIGIVLQQTGVDPYLTVEEVVELFRGYYVNPLPLDELLSLVGLESERKRRVIKLSGGQQRRLDVAVGLAGNPELLFLDEPTTGFDPAARHGAWDMVRGLQALGKTIFLTTHYMDEAEHLADRVAIIRRGQIVAEGAPAHLVSLEAHTTVRFRHPEAAPGLLDGIDNAHGAANGLVTIETNAPTALLYELTRRAREQALELADLTVSRPTLEDIYLRLVAEPEAESAT